MLLFSIWIESFKIVAVEEEEPLWFFSQLARLWFLAEDEN